MKKMVRKISLYKNGISAGDSGFVLFFNLLFDYLSVFFRRFEAAVRQSGGHFEAK